MSLFASLLHHKSHPDIEPVDVAIIGGGVAGGGLGLVLARAGLRVVIVERESRFRDRIRGECVHPWGVRHADAAGLLDVMLEDAGGLELPKWTRYYGGSATDPYVWASDFPGIRGTVSVSHPHLQEVLLQKAEEAGAKVYRPADAHLSGDPETPELVVQSDDAVCSYRPRLLVGADGQRSMTRRWMGGTVSRDPVHHAIGGVLVSGMDLPRDSAHQAFFDGGFTMLFPQDKDQFRVYYVCSSEEAAELRTIENAPQLMERVAAALPNGAVNGWQPIGPLGFFPNSDLVSSKLHAGKALLIGDAAGANDPSQGHGLSLTFRDIDHLRGLLLDTDDWFEVPATYAVARQHASEVLRQHAMWCAPLSTEVGPEADGLRERVRRAREIDPTGGGFAPIFATGPENLVADEPARRQFLGENSVAGMPSDY